MLDLPPPEVLRVGDITVIAPGPAYEHIYENMLGAFEGLIQVAEEAEPPLLLVDLANTRHAGSAFLGFLMRLSGRVTQQTAGRFGVCSATPFCRTVIKTTRMDTVRELFDTRDEAVASFSSNGNE